MPGSHYDTSEIDALLETKADKSELIAKADKAYVDTLIADLDARLKKLENLTPTRPEVDFGTLHGVNLVTSKLTWRESRASGAVDHVQSQDIPKFLQLCKDSNFNFLRIVVYQETYESRKAEFMAELELILSECDRLGLKSYIDPHQWHAGMDAYQDSIGFPIAYKTGYDITGPVCSYDGKCEPPVLVDADMTAWWQNLWTDTLRGGKVHDKIAAFLQEMARTALKYSGCIGVGIINEPQSTRIEDYQTMGDFNRKMTAAIREVSQDLYVFICRDNGMPGFQPNNRERWRLFPANDARIVWDDHNYQPDPAVYASRVKIVLSDFMSKVPDAKQLQVLMGEWNVVLDYSGTAAVHTSNVAKHKVQLQNVKNNGWASCYWCFGKWTGNRNSQTVDANGNLLEAGLTLKDAIAQVYA